MRALAEEQEAADIEGSTALSERERQAMTAADDRHLALLRAATTTHGGILCNGVGDATQAAFASAPDAVAATAKKHGAVSFGSAVPRLVPPVEEHYLRFVSKTFPDLMPRYERAYGGTTISLRSQEAIERRVEQIRLRHGFNQDAMSKRWAEAGKSADVAQAVSDSRRQLPLLV